ncbi:MAG: hypothetical protein KAW12_30535 [Candidatus Aminicenantes bacterium]|nr:hypothetical protein [Candidatus Aminicenantes bacterium]
MLVEKILQDRDEVIAIVNKWSDEDERLRNMKLILREYFAILKFKLL